MQDFSLSFFKTNPSPAFQAYLSGLCFVFKIHFSVQVWYPDHLFWEKVPYFSFICTRYVSGVGTSMQIDVYKVIFFVKKATFDLIVKYISTIVKLILLLAWKLIPVFTSFFTLIDLGGSFCNISPVVTRVGTLDIMSTEITNPWV